MEFGIRGHRVGREEPGKHENGTPIYDTTIAGVQNAWVILEALNRGYVAMSQWEIYDAMYDRDVMPYGTIGDVAHGFPLKPTFYLTRLFTHSLAPGWKACRVDGNTEDCIATVVSGTGNEMTVYLLNRKERSQSVTFHGLPSGRAFRQQIWNKSGDGKIGFGQNVIGDLSGKFTIVAPPGSMIALTAK
jgi:hypothetical protein